MGVLSLLTGTERLDFAGSCAKVGSHRGWSQQGVRGEATEARLGSGLSLGRPEQGTGTPGSQLGGLEGPRGSREGSGPEESGSGWPVLSLFTAGVNGRAGPRSAHWLK